MRIGFSYTHRGQQRRREDGGRVDGQPRHLCPLDQGGGQDEGRPEDEEAGEEVRGEEPAGPHVGHLDLLLGDRLKAGCNIGAKRIARRSVQSRVSRKIGSREQARDTFGNVREAFVELYF